MRGENGVSVAIGEGGGAAGHHHGPAKLEVEMCWPDAASIAGSERLGVTKAKVARFCGGGKVSVVEGGNGVEAGLGLETMRPMEVVAWHGDG